MAQVVEHVLGKDEVTSSNLVSSSKKDRLFHKPVFLLVLFFQAAVSGISKLSANDSENAEVKAFCKDSINSLNRL